LIAEPWDLGAGGYQVGGFPPLWTEWNGHYRDTVRDYWRGEPSTLGEFASRLTGSSDLYERTGRTPVASINFVTAHDGFTLADLVAYNDKHNAANGEDNQDGESHNRSWNCGVEGATDDPEILQLRSRQQRNFLTTLFISQGVPMLSHGDELGRTQQGNNNAYAQDNELAWMDWEEPDTALHAFTRQLISFRRDHPVLRRRRFFTGATVGVDSDEGLPDIAWFDPSGSQMDTEAWTTSFARSLMIFLNGGAIAEPDAQGRPVQDDSLLVLTSASVDPVTFTVPGEAYGRWWTPVLSSDTTLDLPAGLGPGSDLTLPPRSIVIMARPLGEKDQEEE